MTRLLSFLLPLGLYFVGEQLWGSVAGLLVGFGATVALQIVSTARGGKFDIRDVACDFASVAIFGLADIIVAQVSPRASTLATSVVLTLMLFAMYALRPRRILSSVAEVLRPGFSESPYFAHLMRGSLLRMSLWSLASSTLYLVAFIDHGSAAAEWIEDYALLTILLAYVASEIVMSMVRRARYKDSEWVPLVTEAGVVTGGAPRQLVHNGSHWLHAVVHLHIISSDRRLLLQLRPKSKKIQPGRWDTAVGGHIVLGEKLADALRRETKEEVGLTDFEARLSRHYVWHSDVEDEYVIVFKTNSDGPFSPGIPGEVDELRFWTAEELSKAMGIGVLTPNLENELRTGLLDELQTENIIAHG